MNYGIRAERLRHVLKERGLAGAIITSPASIRYLSADIEVPGGQALLITHDALQACDPAGTGSGLPAGALGTDCGPTGANREPAGPRDVSAVITAMRRVKDDAEVTAIAEAAACVDRGLEAARAVVAAGVTDTAIAQAARLAVLGATTGPVEFAFNIGAAQAGADPDATSSGIVMAPGDAVFLDLYPRVGAYFADATRTYCAGPPPRALSTTITALWGALDAAASLLRPGVRAADIDRRCRQELAARGVRADYPHHTGHGVGLQQQEPPWLTPDSADVLLAGDVVALEPGVYGRQMGARVEELFLVRADGPQLISKASRSLPGGGNLGA